MARQFAQEVSHDLERVCGYVDTAGLSLGFNNCYFTNRLPDGDKLMERSYLLFHYFIWDSLVSEMKEEVGADSLNGMLNNRPADVKENTLGLYLCLKLITMRRGGQLSAWEGIRIVRERKE
jgi:hypothetical protein